MIEDDSDLIVINNFLTDEECDTLVKYVDSLESGWGNSNEFRKMSFNPQSEDIKRLVLKCLDETKRVFNKQGLYVAEYLLSYYSTGFAMEVHSDMQGEKDYFLISLVTYLNSEFTGGDIVFPLLNKRHSPKKGDIAMFLSKPDKNMHGVEPVTSGKRYVMPIWITDKKEHAFDFIHDL